jgi:NAD(P)H-hydrate epimerase
MREVDRAMIEDYRILLIQMMENAGRGLARVARDRFLGGDPRGKTVLVLAGTGGNGGGGLVCARRLHGWGARVAVFLSRPPSAFTEIPAHQLDVVRRMGLPIAEADESMRLSEAALLVDALIGYSLSGAPRAVAAHLIRQANAHGAPILALDAPSGLDTTTGTVYDPAIRAAATVTLALPKDGLRAAPAQVGELYLADISVPPELYGEPTLALPVGPIFAQDDVIRLA